MGYSLCGASGEGRMDPAPGGCRSNVPGQEEQTPMSAGGTLGREMPVAVRTGLSF